MVAVMGVVVFSEGFCIGMNLAWTSAYIRGRYHGLGRAIRIIKHLVQK